MGCWVWVNGPMTAFKSEPGELLGSLIVDPGMRVQGQEAVR